MFLQLYSSVPCSFSFHGMSIPYMGCFISVDFINRNHLLTLKREVFSLYLRDWWD
jgi:hypothetical protein